MKVKLSEKKPDIKELILRDSIYKVPKYAKGMYSVN